MSEPPVTQAVTVFRDGPLRRRLLRWSLIQCPYRKRRQGRRHTQNEGHMGHREVAIRKPRGEASGGTSPEDTQMSDLSPHSPCVGHAGLLAVSQTEQSSPHGGLWCLLFPLPTVFLQSVSLLIRMLRVACSNVTLLTRPSPVAVSKTLIPCVAWHFT